MDVDSRRHNVKNIIFASRLRDTDMKKSLKYRLLSTLWFTLLFSISGFLLYIIVFIWGIWAGEPPFWQSVYACLATVLIFNIWGWSFLAIARLLVKNRIASMTLRTRSRVLFFFILAGVLLLAFTYLVFVLLRWIGNGDDVNPFSLQMPGLVLLLTFWFIEMMVVSFFMIEHFSRSTINLYRNKRNLEHNVIKMQYQVLQNQVNPHFLFNNLSVLAAEIENNPANAVEFVQNFSDIYRYVLHQSDKEVVTLKEELDFFDSYLFLYKTRYGDKIRIERNIDSACNGALLPPMTLQQLVENALKHNYMTMESPLVISISIMDGGKFLRFANNIQKARNSQVSGRGLVNLSSRFTLLCGKDIAVTCNDSEFVVTIPLVYEKNKSFSD